jgi:glutathione S-transferase
MSLVLYNHPISTCSQKVRVTLAEKGLDFEERVVELSRAEHLEDWYLALNPNGVVPTLAHDDEVVTDSSAICEYLDEVFGGPKLTPADAAPRARMRAWMRYLEEIPTVAIRAPSFNAMFAARLMGLPAEEFEALTARMPLRKHFLRRMEPAGFPAPMIEESLESLAKCIARVEGALSEGGPFLLGEALTIADLVLLPTIVRMEDLQLCDHWRDKPLVAAWYRAMQRRPSFAAAYYDGSRRPLAPRRA